MKRSPPPIDDARERHVGIGEMAGVLARGFTAGDEELRRRILYHLSACCRECIGALAELTDSAAARDAGVSDVVVLGLRHLVELRRRCPEGSGAAAWLRASHRYWLERVDVEPLAFARVVVEEIRSGALRLEEHAELALPLSSEALELLTEDPRLEALHPERFRDLRALALAYLADDYRVRGQLEEADEHLRRAEAETAHGTADPEVHVTLSELWADLELKRQLRLEALHRIEGAVRLVRGVAIPGRAAETRVRLGLVRLRLRDPRRAATAFHRARTELVPGVDLGAHLRACHYQALAAARSHDYGRALALLEESAELYGDRAPQRLRVERLVMLGVSRFETGTAGAAAPLQQAVDRLCELGLWHDAAQTLAKLGRVYLSTGRPEEAARVDAEHAALLRSPAAHELATTQRWRLRRDLLRHRGSEREGGQDSDDRSGE